MVEDIGAPASFFPVRRSQKRLYADRVSVDITAVVLHCVLAVRAAGCSSNKTWVDTAAVLKCCLAWYPKYCAMLVTLLHL